MSDCSVRPVQPGDMPAITRIYADAVRHGTATFEIEPPDEAEMARRQLALLGAGFPYLVAELDGAVAGYAYAGAYHSRPAYRWTVENSIYVAEQFQRKGLGGRLLARLVAESQARGFRQMIAVIGDSTNAASIALHKTAGFRLIGTLRSVGFKHGHWLDVVVMQHALGEGDSTPP
jgi:L-amino acid N-acyltransferase YncA